MIVQRLDEHTAEDWELQREVNTSPTLKEVCAFLDKRARSLLHARTEQERPSRDRSGADKKVDRARDRNRDKTGTRAGATGEAVASTSAGTNGGPGSKRMRSQLPCPCCSETHPLYKCAQFNL